MNKLIRILNRIFMYWIYFSGGVVTGLLILWILGIATINFNLTY